MDTVKKYLPHVGAFVGGVAVGMAIAATSVGGSLVSKIRGLISPKPK